MKKLLLLLIFLPFISFSQSYSVEYSFPEQFTNEGAAASYYLEIGDGSTYQTLLTLPFAETVFGSSGSALVNFRPTHFRMRVAAVVNDIEDIIYTPVDGHCFNDIIPITDPNGLILNVTLEIEPSLSISLEPNGGTYPSTCETMLLSAPSNYDENVYQWQYSINGGVSWNDLPAYQGLNTFEIAMGDIPGLAVNDDVKFRIRYCSNQTSNVRTSHFITCSPPYNNFSSENTTCLYNNDGGFTITFDRDLESGEEVLFNLFKDAPAGDPAAIAIPIPIVTSLEAGNTFTFNGLETGEYFLTYQSQPDGSVSEEITFEIQAPNELTFNVSGTNISCFGDTDGSIELTANGGTGTYRYILNGGDPVIFTSPYTIENLTSGDYNIQVIDENDCIGNYSTPEETISVTITQPAAELSVEGIVTNATGFELATGALDITVSGGTAPYTYSWDNGETTEDLVDLLAGSYEITVTDTNNCQVSMEFIITQPEELIINVDNYTIISCFGNTDGSITVTASGGYLNYQYQLFKENTPGDFIPVTAFVVTDGSFETNNLISGNYRVHVIDNGGSGIEIQSNIISITEPEELLVTTNTIINVLCAESNSGAIDISVTGGTAPYTYNWNANTYTTEDLTDVSAGIYNLIVTDANGCETSTQFFEVTQPEALAVESVASQISIFGADDGAISLNVIGGTAPYTFEWFADNGFASTDEDITNLAPGTYTLVVYDTNYMLSGEDLGCSYMEEFIIVEPQELAVTIIEDISISCFGSTNGELFADVSGGVAPYTYEWFSIDGGQNPIGQTSAYAENLPVGNYQVEVTDSNGTQVLSGVYNFQQPTMLSIQVENITNVICNGAATGAIDVSISGGIAPYIINWNNGAVNEDLINVVAGTYTITVEDASGCITIQDVEIINLHESFTIENTTINNVSVYEGTDGSILVEFSGGQAPYQIEWVRLSDGSVVGNSEEINNLTADDYEITITDANGCTLTENYTITQPDIVEATITNPSCFNGCDGNISVLVNEGVGDYTYSWSTGNTDATITNLCAGTYEVTINGFGSEPLVRVYEVVNPEPLQINLGKDKTLCQDQSIILSAAIRDTGATYNWTSTNGFISSEAEIEVNEAGTYYVTVINSNGCEATDEIKIQTLTTEIGAEFLVASQAFVDETIVMVDVSHPLPDEVEWILPAAATVVSQNNDLAEISFAVAGEYEIGVLTRVGSCEAIQMKTILVIESEGFVEAENVGGNFIEEFIVYPNPTDGQFFAKVGLKNTSDISLRVFNVNDNSMLDHKTSQGEQNYEIPFNLVALPSGTYVVILETPYGNQVRKVIIQ